jgi:hypothetical protein
MLLSRMAFFGLVATTLALGACGGGGSDGISTASLLDGKSAAGSGEVGGVKADDPTAKATQVAWTSARAQKCGYNFDAAKLKANYLAAETRDGAPPAQIALYDKTYETTFATVTANIKNDADYCTDRRTAQIKGDLQRHLAGNYQPNLPQQKKAASGGFWDGLVTDTPAEAFDQKNFWSDQIAKRDGAKSGQHVD